MCEGKDVSICHSSDKKHFTYYIEPFGFFPLVLLLGTCISFSLIKVWIRKLHHKLKNRLQDNKPTENNSKAEIIGNYLPAFYDVNLKLINGNKE